MGTNSQRAKKKLLTSNLASNSEKIFIGTTSESGNTDEVPIALNFLNNYEIKCKEKYYLGELPIIKYLHDFCKNEKECLVWYIHTKGVTRPGNDYICSWRRFLEYWIITKWKLCVAELEDYDAVGVLWKGTHPAHFQGNFWWAKSSYVSKCNNINFENIDYEPTIRHQAEFFIGTANPKVKNLYETKINMYREKFYPNKFMKIF